MIQIDYIFVRIIVKSMHHVSFGSKIKTATIQVQLPVGFTSEQARNVESLLSLLLQSVNPQVHQSRRNVFFRYKLARTAHF